MKRVMLVTMPSTMRVYGRSVLRAVAAPRPLLSIAELAGSVLAAGGECKILDLQASADPFADLDRAIAEFRPEIAGLTFTTPLFDEAKGVARQIKAAHPEVLVVGGGVHATIFPQEVAREPAFDVAVYGEGDLTLQELVRGQPLGSIRGLAFRNGAGEVVTNPPRPLIANLDDLPMPAWHLFDLKLYHHPKAIARQSPVGTMGTSRGCVYGCTYCTKSVFGRRYRTKTVGRVLDEFELLLASGVREVLVWDDTFTTDLPRAKAICDEVVRRGLRFPWQLEGGVRVDSVDAEFFEKCMRAGCYRVAFGFESGSDYVLRSTKKGTTTEQARQAVKLARAAGIETCGFFMLGLPEDTVETLEQTIELACTLGLDYAKATILTPLPATPIFEDLAQRGLLRTTDWSRYNFHTASRVYDHPHLSWETLEAYYRKFHRRFYFRPSYVARRVVRSVRRGELLDDARVVFVTFLKAA